MRKLVTATVALLFSALPALADGSKVQVYAFDGSFEDASFAVESAIVNQGLVIDSVSHVGAMLNRTKGETGGQDLFQAADVFQFCSAKLSRKVMEADPLNIAYCPYRLYVAEKDGKVTIGHLTMPDGPMKEVETLLQTIAKEATE